MPTSWFPRSSAALLGLLVLLALGCRRPAPTATALPEPLELIEASDRVSGAWPLEGQRVVVVENVAGPVVVDGTAAPGGVRWFVNRVAKAPSRAQALDALARIALVWRPTPDTLFVALATPPLTDSLRHAALVSLALPDTLDVVLRAADEVFATGLGGALTVRAGRAVDVRSHVGRCDVETVEGAVAMALTLPAAAACRLHTGHGDLLLAVPVATSATVALRTDSGHVAVEGFGLTVTRQAPGLLEGTLGDGAGRLTLTTGGGDVTLRGEQ